MNHIPKEPSRQQAKADRRLYKRLVIAFHDVVELQGCAVELTSRLAGGSADDPQAIVRKALTTSLIVGYGRLFAENDDAPDVARRLPTSVIAHLSEPLRQVHERVMERRNTEFAHSDPQPSSVTVRVNLGPFGQPFPIPESAIVRSPLNPSELHAVRDILEAAYAFIYDEMERIRKHLKPGEMF